MLFKGNLSTPFRYKQHSRYKKLSCHVTLPRPQNYTSLITYFFAAGLNLSHIIWAWFYKYPLNIYFVNVCTDALFTCWPFIWPPILAAIATKKPICLCWCHECDIKLKYQPSGAGGTRSQPTTPHRLQHLTASLIQNGRRGLERG